MSFYNCAYFAAILVVSVIMLVIYQHEVNPPRR